MTIQATQNTTATQEAIETQMMKLRYMKDLNALLKSKPSHETAPNGAKMLGLNLNDGEDFGKWTWLAKQDKTDMFVYVEPVEKVAV